MAKAKKAAKAPKVTQNETAVQVQADVVTVAAPADLSPVASVLARMVATWRTRSKMAEGTYTKNHASFIRNRGKAIGAALASMGLTLADGLAFLRLIDSTPEQEANRGEIAIRSDIAYPFTKADGNTAAFNGRGGYFAGRAFSRFALGSGVPAMTATAEGRADAEAITVTGIEEGMTLTIPALAARSL